MYLCIIIITTEYYFESSIIAVDIQQVFGALKRMLHMYVIRNVTVTLM